MSMFPQLLISKAVNDAKNKLNLQANKSQLPSGINRRLISYLLKLNTKTCICGRDLCDDEREHIRKFLDMMPPKSYSSMYQDFTKTAARWGNGYDKQSVEEIIKRVLINQKGISFGIRWTILKIRSRSKTKCCKYVTYFRTTSNSFFKR